MRGLGGPRLPGSGWHRPWGLWGFQMRTPVGTHAPEGVCDLGVLVPFSPRPGGRGFRGTPRAPRSQVESWRIF